MRPQLTRTASGNWQEEPTARTGTFKYMELSGERLGARLEELKPGSTSSVHHYHSLEEEHVFILSGSSTLIQGMGDAKTEQELTAGDHVWFAAGNEVPHHLVNNTQEPCQFLVYGERNEHDVVYYPEHTALMVKTPQRQLYKYEPTKPANS